VCEERGDMMKIIYEEYPNYYCLYPKNIKIISESNYLKSILEVEVRSCSELNKDNKCEYYKKKWYRRDVGIPLCGRCKFVRSNNNYYEGI